MPRYNLSDQWQNIPNNHNAPHGFHRFKMDYAQAFHIKSIGGLAFLQRYNGKAASVALDCFALDIAMQIEMETEPTDLHLIYVLEGHATCLFQPLQVQIALELKRHYILLPKVVDSIVFNIPAGKFAIFQVSLPFIRLSHILPGLSPNHGNDKGRTGNLQTTGLTNKTVRNKIMEIVHSRASGPRLELLLKARALDLLYLYLESTGHPALERQLAKKDMTGLESVKSYISKNLDALLDNGSLSKIYGKSISVFRRDFTLYIGIPPHVFIKHTRLQRAMETLTITERPIRTIALEVGYSGISSFSRAFKQEFGNPPEWFRQNR